MWLEWVIAGVIALVLWSPIVILLRRRGVTWRRMADVMIWGGVILFAAGAAAAQFGGLAGDWLEQAGGYAAFGGLATIVLGSWLWRFRVAPQN